MRNNAVTQKEVGKLLTIDRRRLLMIAIAIISALLAAWTTYQVALERTWILRIDKSGLAIQVERGTSARELAELFILLGQRGLVVVILLLVALWLFNATGSWHPIVLVLLGTVALNVVVAGMKLVMARSRPKTGEPEFLNPDTLGDIGLFPSGHAANAAFSWLVLLYLLSRKGGWSHWASAFGGVIAVALTAIMSLGSLMLGHHWITDLATGAFVGWSIAAAFIAGDITVAWAKKENWQLAKINSATAN
jgi:membrane-associated phospholipid phosphatase